MHYMLRHNTIILLLLPWDQWINTLRPRQNGRQFADDTFKHIFLNENVRIAIKISLKFVPQGAINNIPVLVQIMAWRRPGDKPLSEPMMVSLPTHICVTQPQWVKGYILRIMHTVCSRFVVCSRVSGIVSFIHIRLVYWLAMEWSYEFMLVKHVMTSSNGNIFRVTGHFVRWIHRPPVNSPHKGQWRGALMFSLICV